MVRSSGLVKSFFNFYTERVGSAAAAQPDHVFGGQAERRQCQGLGRMRRLQQDNAPAGDLGQRRAEQPKFADSGLLQQQLGQGADRPAATWQLHRQGGMAGFDALRGRAGQLGGSPE